MIKLPCIKCHKKYWAKNKKDIRLCEECEGVTTRYCVQCGVELNPSDRGNVCGDACRIERDKEYGKRYARYRRAKEKETPPQEMKTSQPPQGEWMWMKYVLNDEGRRVAKRNILSALKSKSSPCDWPWTDVFTGYGPPIIDECQL